MKWFENTLMLFVLMFCCMPLFAEDMFFNGEQSKEGVSVVAEELGSVGDSSRLFALERRLSSLEAKVSLLESKAVDAKEVEEIAERVVKKYISQLQVAINKPDGSQRVETFTVDSPDGVYSFELAPGEVLSSYTDVVTGEVVRVGSPTAYVTTTRYSRAVPSWQTKYVEFRQQPYQVTQPRRVAFRAVTTQRVVETSPSVFQNLLQRSGTCRIVNGRQVCD